ncbi:MAG: hypothetical protein AAF799_06390 [Myxococcota bacterium]
MHKTIALLFPILTACALDAAAPVELVPEDSADPREPEAGDTLAAAPDTQEFCVANCSPMADTVAAFAVRNQQSVGCANFGARYFNYEDEHFRRAQDSRGPDFNSSLEDCLDGYYASYPMWSSEDQERFGPVPNSAIRFLSSSSMVEPVRLTFNGQFDVQACNVEIQPLVDGERFGKPFMISSNARLQTVAYSWFVPVGEGMHTASFQWSTDGCPEGSGPTLRNVTVLAEAAARTAVGDAMASTAVDKNPLFVSQPEGGDSGWVDLPLDLDPLGIVLEQAGPLAIELSGLWKTHDEMFVEARALVDGMVIGELTLVDQDLDESSPFVGELAVTRPRTVTFVDDSVSAGQHDIEVQVRMVNYGNDGNKEFALADAHVSAIARSSPHVPMAVESFAPATPLDSTTWVELPQPNTTLVMPVGGELIATATLDISQDYPDPGGIPYGPTANIEVAPVIDGVIREELAVRYSGPRFERDSNQWTFSIKDVPAEPKSVGLAYRRTVGELGTVVLERGTLVVEGHAFVGPDLGLGPRIGHGSMPKPGRPPRRDSRLEPGPVGENYPLLAVLFDDKRTTCDGPNPVGPDFNNGPWANCVGAGQPNHPTATAFDLWMLLYRDPTNVAGYLEAANRGVAELTDIGVYDVATANAPAPDSSNDYTIQGCTCGLGSDPQYVSARQRIIAEAILGAKDQGNLDYSDFDHNGDGALSPDELNIFVVTPESDFITGSRAQAIPAAIRPLCKDYDTTPSCDGSEMLVIDGVTFENVVVWRGDISAPRNLEDAYIATHELLHVIESMDDAYVSGLPNSDPGVLDIMSSNSVAGNGLADSFQRPSGVTALAEGWVDPLYPEEGDGLYTLEDVAFGNQVMILPRLDGPTREYFLLEVRQDRPPTVDLDAYDYNLNDSGLAIWHVIEPSDECVDDDWSDCEATFPEFCPMDGWSFYSDDSYARYIARIIQPNLTYETNTMRGTQMTPELRLWSAAGQSVSGVPGSGLCPGGSINDQSTGVPELQWSDGSPAPYTLSNFVYDQTMGTVSFELLAPNF